MQKDIFLLKYSAGDNKVRTVSVYYRFVDRQPRVGQKVLACIDGEWQVCVFYLWERGKCAKPLWMVSNGKEHGVTDKDVWTALPGEEDICALLG